MPLKNYDYAYFTAIADYVKNIINDTPDLAVILGTGLGDFHKRIENPVEIAYIDIPGFLVSTAPGHAGKLIFGTVGGKKVICMAGRFHRYEGYDYEQLTLPIRLFKLLGAKYTIITNAAGGVNADFGCGDIMLITDHIKLNGDSPLGGKNIDEFGPRFFDVSDMYTKKLLECARKCEEGSPLKFREGVYMFFTGPQFETAAEVRAARILGADAVGMSTVTEALTAAHCSMPLLGFSVITNMATGVVGNGVDHSEVETVAGSITADFCDYIGRIIASVNPDTLEIEK